MYGVSPAYFFSRFSTDFTVPQYASALSGLQKLGYDSFQIEVFHHDRLGEWRGESSLIAKTAGDLGLGVSQFVAHFILRGFENEEALLSNYGFDEIHTVLDILENFPGCDLVTVPMPAFSLDSVSAYTAQDYRRLRDRLTEKLGRMLEAVEASKRRMALEIVPGSLIGGIAGFERIREELRSDTLGYNFDTGHAWSSKEAVSLIPARLGKRIYGTHLKDNFGNENLPLVPGRGTIPWASVFRGLIEAGYQGSWDVEVVCPSAEVDAAYTEALAFLKKSEIAVAIQ